LVADHRTSGAGADTTSIAMRSCLLYLGQNPIVLRKLHDEVDAFYQSQGSSGDSITYHQASGLPYLGAVIKEATRLFPSINFMLPRHAPPGFEVQGYKIPPSVQVGISPIAQNRDRAIWGEDADVFRPERWLESEEQARFLESSNMLFGGNGPRACVGKNIALVELHKFLAQFVRQFDFKIVNPEKPWRVTTFWFSYQHDFNLRLTRRAVKN
jgi:cytochrome P450